jgi:hypothetical protein
MTTAAGDSAVEEAFEAYLAGKRVPEHGAALAAFAGAVRATATEPGRPNAALAELLATGLLVDQPPLSARTAKRRRRRMWFFTAIFAKIASAGAIAQAATGAGIVLVGFTGVGAAGALPTPVQHGFATVVAAITPLHPSDGTSDVQPAVDSTAPASASTDATTAATTDPATAPATSTPTNFGQRVSTQAHNGGVSGKDVSSWAHERNAARKSGAATSTDAPETDDAEKTSATETDAPDAPEATDSDGSGSHSGHGKH